MVGRRGCLVLGWGWCWMLGMNKIGLKLWQLNKQVLSIWRSDPDPIQFKVFCLISFSCNFKHLKKIFSNLQAIFFFVGTNSGASFTIYQYTKIKYVNYFQMFSIYRGSTHRQFGRRVGTSLNDLNQLLSYAPVRKRRAKSSMVIDCHMSIHLFESQIVILCIPYKGFDDIKIYNKHAKLNDSAFINTDGCIFYLYLFVA